MWYAPGTLTSTRRFDPVTVIGFLIPMGLAVLVGLIIEARSHPIAVPVQQQTSASGSVVTTTPVNQPSAAEIAAANQAILDYCSNDLRQGTACALLSGSTVTAPGFVETGLKMNGSFAVDGSSSQGLALAKGSTTTWAVIWVGQNCIPADVAAQNAVPSTLKTCSS